MSFNQKSAKITQLESLGVFILLKLEPFLEPMIRELRKRHGDEITFRYFNVTNRLVDSSNEELEAIIGAWHGYLRDNMICHLCKMDLESRNECESGWKSE